MPRPAESGLSSGGLTAGGRRHPADPPGGLHRKRPAVQMGMEPPPAGKVGGACSTTGRVHIREAKYCKVLTTVTVHRHCPTLAWTAKASVRALLRTNHRTKDSLPTVPCNQGSRLARPRDNSAL